MKQVITFLFLSLFTQYSLSAQATFAPVGAGWNYTGEESMYNFLAGLDPNYPNKCWNVHVQSEKDTVVDNTNCRKLTVTQMARIDNGAPFSDTSLNLFVYDNADTVFFYMEDTHRFEPLYVFNVNEGDTVHIPYFDLPGQPFTYIVDSVRTELYDTSHLRSFYTHLIAMPVDSVLYSVNWGFVNKPNADSFIHKGKYTEKIGGYLGFFPIHCPVGAVGGFPGHQVPSGNLQCYKDNNINYKADSQPCDYIPSLTSIQGPLTSKIDIGIFPNPASGQITIKGSDLDNVKEICVYDLTGRRLETVILSKQYLNSNSYRMDISRYIQGVYIIRLRGENFSFTQRLTVLQ